MAPSLEGRGWGTDPVEIAVCWSKTQNNKLFGNHFRTKPPRGSLWPVKLVFDDYHTSRSSIWVMYSHGSSKPLINSGFQQLKIELIFDVFHENYSYELRPTASKWVLEKPSLVQPHTPNLLDQDIFLVFHDMFYLKGYRIFRMPHNRLHFYTWFSHHFNPLSCQHVP